MNNGKVLIVAGFGQRRRRDELPGRGLGPAGRTRIVTQSLAWDMFCNGMVGPARRPRRSSTAATCSTTRSTASRATPCSIRRTGLFTDLQNMAHGRWYPTVTTLGDGRVMTFSGLNETGGTNTAVEIYTAGSGWSAEYRGRLDAAALSAHAPAAGRHGLLLRLGHAARRIFNPATHDVVGGRRHHELQRHADLRHVGPAAADAGERLQAARDDLRRRQPGDGHHGNHRSLGGHAAVAVRPVDVAAADRDERDDPAERQGAGDGRIDERRRRRHGEPERRSLRPGDEHVQPGGRQRVSAPLSFRLAAAAGRHGAARRRQPGARLVRAAHRDLLAARICSTPNGTPGRAADDHQRDARAHSATAARSRSRHRMRRASRRSCSCGPARRRTRSTWISGWSGCRSRPEAAS